MFDETPAQAYALRYGVAPDPELGQALQKLAPFLTHRSVRKFAPEPVPETTVQALLAAAQSASTSSNLQLWSVISIQDPSRRDHIATLCADQTQIREAAWFFAFLADHHRLWKTAQSLGENPDALPYNEFYTMAVVDAALAAERLVCAAESIGLGACYIGALRNNVHAVKEALNLPERVAGLFGLCLGVPHPDLQASGPGAGIKPRLPQSAVWFQETYDPDTEADTDAYNTRMADFYQAQNMNPQVTWAMRSARRATTKHLTGREALKPFLNAQSLDLQ